MLRTTEKLKRLSNGLSSALALMSVERNFSDEPTDTAGIQVLTTVTSWDEGLHLANIPLTITISGDTANTVLGIGLSGFRVLDGVRYKTEEMH